MPARGLRAVSIACSGRRGRRLAGFASTCPGRRRSHSAIHSCGGRPLMEMSAASLSPARGRVLIVLAALLWSTSGAFTKLLREDTAPGLNQPPVAPLQIAAWRALFAGLALLPLLRRRDVTFRRPMVFTAVTFAA